ncbi:hypothetical protein BaRGS_00003677, partial [Batillaria attramentaria]
MKTVILIAVVAAVLLACIPRFASCTTYSAYTCGYTCPRRNGGWSSWRASSYGSCSRTCGGGTRYVTDVRYCNNPTPLYGGSSCYGSSTRRRILSCNTRTCPPREFNQMIFLLDMVPGLRGGRPQPEAALAHAQSGIARWLTLVPAATRALRMAGGRVAGTEPEHDSRIVTPMPAHVTVNGAWSPWGPAVKGCCSATCGNGTRNITFTRTCTNPAPSNRGRTCTGLSSKVQTEACNLDPCPVDGGWSAFAVKMTFPCSVTCGNGTKIVKKTRECNNPVPQNGGAHCKGKSKKQVTRPCKSKPCPC